MISIRTSLYLFVLILCSFVCSSCEHRELTDPRDIHLIRVYLDEDIKNVTYGYYDETLEHPEFKKPLNMHAALASAKTGEVVYGGLLRNQGSDRHGNYIEGYVKAEPGEYHLLIYQLGSSLTNVRGMNNYYDMQAYTSMVSQRVLGLLSETSKVLDRESIVGEPEHILVSRYDNLTIHPSEELDTLKTLTGEHFRASTIAKSYYLQLRIKGVKWINTAAAVLSGMAGSYRLCEEDGMIRTDPVNLFFYMKHDGGEIITYDENSTSILYATFTTFGKIPDKISELTLNFEFTKSDESTQVERIDITEAFSTPLAIEEQWILLDKEITITKPVGSGGMDPGVEGWNEENADLYM